MTSSYSIAVRAERISTSQHLAGFAIAEEEWARMAFW